MNTQNSKVGLDALLTPENSVLVLIDHQAFQFANTRNMDPTMILNNTIGLAKAAKAFKVPTIPYNRHERSRRQASSGASSRVPRTGAD